MQRGWGYKDFTRKKSFDKTAKVKTMTKATSPGGSKKSRRGVVKMTNALRVQNCQSHGGKERVVKTKNFGGIDADVRTKQNQGRGFSEDEYIETTTSAWGNSLILAVPDC